MELYLKSTYNQESRILSLPMNRQVTFGAANSLDSLARDIPKVTDVINLN